MHAPLDILGSVCRSLSLQCKGKVKNDLYPQKTRGGTLSKSLSHQVTLFICGRSVRDWTDFPRRETSGSCQKKPRKQRRQINWATLTSSNGKKPEPRKSEQVILAATSVLRICFSLALEMAAQSLV